MSFFSSPFLFIFFLKYSYFLFFNHISRIIFLVKKNFGYKDKGKKKETDKKLTIS